MPDSSLSQEQLYALLQYTAKRLGVTPAQLGEALSSGRVEDLAGRLPPESAAKLQSMLGDRARAQRLLDSPQAQALLRRLTGR